MATFTSTFQVLPEHEGKLITVMAVASNDGGSDQKSSEPTEPVQPAPPNDDA